MRWILDPFHFEFMQRALLGCILIGFTNGFLSAFIVLRRMALLADALSHSLLPGLAIGAIFFGLAPMGLFFGAVSAAAMVALGGQLLSRSSRLKDDTAIAALYTIAFALGILLLNYSRVRVDLHHFLFGNILGLTDLDLWISYGISALTLLVLISQQRALLLTLFDATVAKSQGVPVTRLLYLLMILMVLAMISSLQAVGVVLSLGLLVLPGATVYLWCDSFDAMAWGGGVIGMIGSCAGLLISYWTNIGSGPAIVLVLGLFLLASYLFSPRYGILIRLLKPKHLHEESLARWRS
ncbi:MAG: manganese ABC transporter permease [Verrucomicrobia bacterium Tous-C9LFEB]|nr:MAG: manganese ABC transporter permease [Verrucomicrobia bacterium Tous-C9LFEB]